MGAFGNAVADGKSIAEVLGIIHAQTVVAVVPNQIVDCFESLLVGQLHGIASQPHMLILINDWLKVELPHFWFV